MQSILVLIVVVALLSNASAFFLSSVNTRQSRMNMMFNFGKSTPKPTEYKVNQGSANKGTYIPDGVTPAQYQKVLEAQAKEAQAKKAKFFKGKQTESLTEWINKCEEKGLKGKDMLLKGHRMVKAKYDSFYTDESPV